MINDVVSTIIDIIIGTDCKRIIVLAGEALVRAFYNCDVTNADLTYVEDLLFDKNIANGTNEFRSHEFLYVLNEMCYRSTKSEAEMRDFYSRIKNSDVLESFEEWIERSYDISFTDWRLSAV